uniref:RNA polymerase factor sigma-54 n=1 Tax=Roseibium sp. TaxID=1936156 RepID=UPI003D10C5FD
EGVLAVLQTFDPPGVFARNLAECLKLQLIDRNRFDPAMEALVENIELLAKRDLAALRKVCGVDDEDLMEMIAEIRALDPKPGSVFGTSLVQPVVPDVFVRPANDGTWAVELNSDTLPKVLVNQTYFARVIKTARNETEKEYLTDSLQTANWLAKSLDQRAKTILKVSTEIVRQQDGFLTYGIEHLRPLNLKTVADAISMHESTVSRVTSNKFMATPRGIFELKYFFSSAISATVGGDSHSAESVRHKIRQMIDAEDPKAILSDDTIVKILKGEGIDIARRTVAKYREAMKIGSSVQRRREKNSRI